MPPATVKKALFKENPYLQCLAGVANWQRDMGSEEKSKIHIHLSFNVLQVLISVNPAHLNTHGLWEGHRGKSVKAMSSHEDWSNPHRHAHTELISLIARNKQSIE